MALPLVVPPVTRSDEVHVTQIRVAIVTTYPAVRAGLEALLVSAGHEVVEHVSGDRDDLGQPDVIVADTTDLTEVEEDVPLVLFLEPGARVPEHAGALALLPRDASAAQIDLAVRATSVGLLVTDPAVASFATSFAATEDVTNDTNERGTPLTAREVEVLRLLASGMTNRGTALALGISEHTVKFHVSSVLARLGARSRTEAVSIAARMGLLPL